MIEMTVPVSPEQQEVIADYALGDGELGLLPDERQWMIAQARKKHPGCVIKAADLNLHDLTWVLSIELKP